MLGNCNRWPNILATSSYIYRTKQMIMTKKSTLSESLKSRLKAYSMTAGAVAAGVAGVNAQVVYTDIDPDVTGDTLYLDLNNDGTDDFVFLASADVAGSSSSFNVYRNFVVALNSNAVAGSISSSYFYPYAFSSGSIIDGNQPFNSGSNFQTLGWDYFGISATSAAYTFGNIRVGQGEAYVGLRLDVNGQTHYGWARLQLNLGGTITIMDYAYDANACVGIAAGATTGGITPVAAATPSNVVASDAGNAGNGADLQVTFDVPSSEAGIAEYRVYAVKSANAGSFDMNAAEAVVMGNYTAAAPTGSAQTVTMNGANDTDGDAIVINQEYTVFVMSIADCANAQMDAMSTSSDTVILTPPVGIGEVNNLGYSMIVSGNQLRINAEQTIESLNVYSIDGKVVATANDFVGNHTVSVNAASGVYIVNIKTAAGTKSEKVFLN